MNLSDCHATPTQQKLNPDVYGKPDPAPASDAASLEIKEIHDPFSKWLKDRRIPFIHANPATESTIGEGIQDYTVFYQGRVVCIEAKSRTGKRTANQIAWAMIMEQQGFTVHLTRSLRECIELLEQPPLQPCSTE